MGQKILWIFIFLFVNVSSLFAQEMGHIRFGWSSQTDSPQAVLFRALNQFGEELSAQSEEISFQRKGQNNISLSDRNSKMVVAKRHHGLSFEYRLTLIFSDPKYLESEWTIEVQSLQGILYNSVLKLLEFEANKIEVPEPGQMIQPLQDSLRFINLGDRFILLIGERYLLLLQQNWNDFVRKPWFQFGLYETKVFYGARTCEQQLEGYSPGVY